MTTCEHWSCDAESTRAVRVFVPVREGLGTAAGLMTIHRVGGYCDAHAVGVRLAQAVPPSERASFREYAADRGLGPLDFDAATVVTVPLDDLAYNLFLCSCGSVH